MIIRKENFDVDLVTRLKIKKSCSSHFIFLENEGMLLLR